MTTRRCFTASLLAGLYGTSQGALAQDKPIRIIVPYGAGGLVDIGARIVAQHMSLSLKVPLLIENKPGGNANIGAALAAQAPADGLTLLASASYFTTNPLVEPQLRWKPGQFTPVARFATSPSVLVVSSKLPYPTLQALLAAAREPGKVSVGESGPGASQTMVKELLADAAGVQFLTVQYAQGGTTYVTDLLNGDVTLGIIPVNVGIGLVQSGKARALAITAPARLAQLPDTPTLAEAGYPQASVDSWLGLHAPTGTPPAVVDRLAQSVLEACRDEGVQERLTRAGAQVAALDSADFAQFLAADQARGERFARLRQKMAEQAR